MLGTANKWHSEIHHFVARQYMFVCMCFASCTSQNNCAHCTCARDVLGISFWVVASAVAVGLTRVKPGLPETGLTPLLSCGLCVWGLKIFWPFPHVRVTRARAFGEQLRPQMCLALSLCLSFLHMCFSRKCLYFFFLIWWKTSICKRSDLRTLCVNLFSLFLIWVSVHKTCCSTPFLRKLKLRS